MSDVPLGSVISGGTVPVPKLVILAERFPEVPVAKDKLPFATAALEVEVVVKL